MIGKLRQLSEPRLRQQAGIEKSQTPVERDILVQWARKTNQVGLLQLKRFYSVLLLRDFRRRFARDNSCIFFFEYTCNCSLDKLAYFMHKNVIVCKVDSCIIL